MLSYDKALERIRRATPPPQVVKISLWEALGAVLAQPIVARINAPSFDNSAVDGYAIRMTRATETPSPLILQVVGRSEAGRPFHGVVRAGEAVRILTGAPIPRGADAVVMQEHARRRGVHVAITAWPTPGRHIRRQGEDVSRGDTVLRAGARLRPQEIGLLAALGVGRVPVYRRPTVAILTTGDELQPPGSRLRSGHIYESNGALLRALVAQTGAHPRSLGIVRDQPQALRSKMAQGLDYDLLLIAGGVSVGDKDFVRRAAQACGVARLFWQVNIKPGMPLFIGRRGRTLVFGLPGNPVSVFVTFEEFVKPALLRLMGRQAADGYTTPAQLAQELKVSTARQTHFIRVRSTGHNGHRLVEPVTGQGSHCLRSLVEADGWIRVRSHEGPWPAGARVMVKQASCEMFNV